jgi:DNA-binding GntR family transcriptional regulator
VERDTTEIELTLDKSSPVPLYFQLARKLEAAVADGRLAKGTYLGNEIELAERWLVSRPTVRRAIQELVDGGFLVRQRGVGTQVVNDQIRRRVTTMSLYDDLASQSRAPRTSVRVHEHVPAEPRIAADLDVAVGALVVHIERCRDADGKRLAIMRNWLTIEAAGEITSDQLSESGLYAALRANGVRPHSASQRIGACAASAIDAGLLNLPTGAPLLTMRRVMHDAAGRPVEVGEHVFDASTFSFETTVLEL